MGDCLFGSNGYLLGEAEVIQQLDKGADGWTPLQRASVSGSKAMVRLLLSRGAKINLTDEAGNTPLHLSCWNEKLDVTVLLLNSGADCSIMRKDGNTSLHLACARGNVAIADALLRRGASTSCSNLKNQTPVDLCNSDKIRSLVQAYTTISNASAKSAPAVSLPAISVSTPAAASSSTSVRSPRSDHQLALQIETLTTQLRERDAQLAERTSELAERTREGDALQAQLANRTRERDATGQRERVAVQERDAAIAERTRLITQLEECRRERDAAFAERDQLRAELEKGATGAADSFSCPFQRYQAHCFVPGVVPPGSGPGLYDVAPTSSLFQHMRHLFDTGGSWMFSQRPVAGFRLARVQAVVPETYTLSGYNSAQARMNALRVSGGAHFNQDSEDFSLAQVHVLNVLRDSFLEKAPGSSNRTVNTLYCYHGPRREHVSSICSNGMVAVGGMDAGYFGSGCYTTLNMEYAVKYAHGDFDTDANGVPTGRRASPNGLYPVIMLAATVGMAYPVTREVDYQPGQATSQFFGRPLKRGFDAHVICVNERSAYQAVSRDQCEYVELVIEQQAQLLPLAVLWFERIN